MSVTDKFESLTQVQYLELGLRDVRCVLLVLPIRASSLYPY